MFDMFRDVLRSNEYDTTEKNYNVDHAQLKSLTMQCLELPDRLSVKLSSTFLVSRHYSQHLWARSGPITIPNLYSMC